MDINNLIKKAFNNLKANNTEENKFRLNTLKMVKAKFQEYETGRDTHKNLITLPDGTKAISEADQNKILSKMVKELEDDADKIGSAKPALAEEYRKQAAIVSEYVPKAATAEEITEHVRDYVVDHDFVTVENTRGLMPKSEMGKCIKYVKEKLPNADGKTVSQVVMKFIQK